MSVSASPQSAPSPPRPAHPPAAPRARRQVPTLERLALALILAVLLRPELSGLFDDPAVQTWATIFVSITVQAPCPSWSSASSCPAS